MGGGGSAWDSSSQPGRPGLPGLRGASASRPAPARPPRPPVRRVRRSSSAVFSPEPPRERFRGREALERSQRRERSLLCRGTRRFCREPEGPEGAQVTGPVLDSVRFPTSKPALWDDDPSSSSRPRVVGAGFFRNERGGDQARLRAQPRGQQRPKS